MPFNFEDIDPEAYRQSVVKYSDDLMKQSVSPWQEGQTLLAFTAEGKPIRVTPGGGLSPLDREKLDMLQIGGDPTIYLDAYGEYKHVQFSELAGEPKDNSTLWNELQKLIPRNIATSLMKDMTLEVPEEVRLDLVYHGVYTANGLPFEQRLALFSDDLSFSLIAPNQVRISVTNTPVAPGDGKITIHDVRHDTDQTFSVNQSDDQTITLDWSEVREKQNELRSGSDSYPSGNLNPRIATINGMAILGEEAVEINFGNLPGDALDNASISALVDTLEEEIAEVVAHSDYRDITSLHWSDNELIAKRENGPMGPLVVTLPDVTLTMRGLATPALVAQVDQNTADIASLEGLGLVIADLGTDSPTQEELTAAWEEVKTNAPSDGARVVNLHNHHLWIFGETATGTIWVDYGNYEYAVATTSDPGLVLASEDVESNYGKIAVGPDGVMTLIGYNSLMRFADLVTDLETDDATRPAAASLTYELNDIKAAKAFNPTAGRILVDDGAGNPSDGEYLLSELQLKLSAAQITAINRAIFNLPAASHMLYLLHQYSLLSVDESGAQALNLIRFEHDASDAVVISGVNPFHDDAGNVKAYLWDAEYPENEIATIGDLTYAAAPDEKYLTYDSAHKLTIKELSIDDSRVSETAAIKLKKILADATQVDKYLIVGQSGEIVYTYGSGGGGGSSSGFLSGVVLPPYEPSPLLETDDLWDPETAYTQDPLGLDYSDSDNWYVLPSKKKYETDVFFFMPTWVINAEKAAKSPYLDSRDEELEEAAARIKAYVLTIFASDRLHFNVYFPRVRALNGAALGTDSGWDEMYDLLFEGPTGKDAMNAFDYYMRHENKGKQYILIGQEQGAFLAYFCLRYVVGEGADAEVQDLLLKAYLADFLMNSDYASALPYPDSQDWDDRGTVAQWALADPSERTKNRASWDDSTPWANSPLSGKEFSQIADDEPYVLNSRSLLSYQKGMGAISTKGATGLATNPVSLNGTKTFCPIDRDNVPLDKDTFFTQAWLDLCDTYNLSYWGVFSLSMFIGSLEALWSYYTPGRPSPMGTHYVNLSDIEQDDYLYKLDDGKSDKFYQDVDTISELKMSELHVGDKVKRIQLKEYNSDTYLGKFGMGQGFTFYDEISGYYYDLMYRTGVPNIGSGLFISKQQGEQEYTLLQGDSTGRSALTDFSLWDDSVIYNAETRVLTFTNTVVLTARTGSPAPGPTEDAPFYNFEVITATNEKRWNLRDVFDYIGESYYDKFAIDGALKDLMQAYNDYVRWGQYNYVGSEGEVYMSRPLSQTDTTPQLLRTLNPERFVINCLNADLTAIKFGEQLTATAYDVQNNYLKINSIRNSYSVEGDNGTAPVYKLSLLGSEATGDTEPGFSYTWPATGATGNYGIEHTASKQNYYTAWFNGLINEDGLRYSWKDGSKTITFDNYGFLLQSNPNSQINYRWYSDQEYFIMYNRFTEQNISKDRWIVRFSNQEQTGTTFMQEAGYSSFYYESRPNNDAARPWWTWQMVGENADSSKIPGLFLTWAYNRQGDYSPTGFFKADDERLEYKNRSGANLLATLSDLYYEGDNEVFDIKEGLRYSYPLGEAGGMEFLALPDELLFSTYNGNNKFNITPQELSWKNILSWDSWYGFDFTQGAFTLKSGRDAYEDFIWTINQVQSRQALGQGDQMYFGWVDNNQHGFIYKYTNPGTLRDELKFEVYDTGCYWNGVRLLTSYDFPNTEQPSDIAADIHNWNLNQEYMGWTRVWQRESFNITDIIASQLAVDDGRYSMLMSVFSNSQRTRFYKMNYQTGVMRAQTAGQTFSSRFYHTTVDVYGNLYFTHGNLFTEDLLTANPPAFSDTLIIDTEDGTWSSVNITQPFYSHGIENREWASPVMTPKGAIMIYAQGYNNGVVAYYNKEKQITALNPMSTSFGGGASLGISIRPCSINYIGGIPYKVGSGRDNAGNSYIALTGGQSPDGGTDKIGFVLLHEYDERAYNGVNPTSFDTAIAAMDTQHLLTGAEPVSGVTGWSVNSGIHALTGGVTPIINPSGETTAYARDIYIYGSFNRPQAVATSVTFNVDTTTLPPYGISLAMLVNGQWVTLPNRGTYSVTVNYAQEVQIKWLYDSTQRIHWDYTSQPGVVTLFGNESEGPWIFKVYPGANTTLNLHPSYSTEYTYFTYNFTNTENNWNQAVKILDEEGVEHIVASGASYTKKVYLGGSWVFSNPNGLTATAHILNPGSSITGGTFMIIGYRDPAPPPWATNFGSGLQGTEYVQFIYDSISSTRATEEATPKPLGDVTYIKEYGVLQIRCAIPESGFIGNSDVTVVGYRTLWTDYLGTRQDEGFAGAVYMQNGTLAFSSSLSSRGMCFIYPTADNIADRQAEYTGELLPQFVSGNSSDPVTKIQALSRDKDETLVLTTAPITLGDGSTATYTIHVESAIQRMQFSTKSIIDARRQY
ncbi:MAG: hypothetical protein MdMp024_0021 [Bacteroidales bacterium]